MRIVKDTIQRIKGWVWSSSKLKYDASLLIDTTSSTTTVVICVSISIYDGFITLYNTHIDVILETNESENFNPLMYDDWDFIWFQQHKIDWDIHQINCSISKT